jgi:hypothetical protein
MSTDETTPRSRRALLAAAAGAAGALAASAAVPAAMRAADPDDVVKGVDNATTATTTVTDTGEGSTAFAGHATGTGTGYGLEGTALGAAGVFGWSVSAPDWGGDPPFDPAFTLYAGVFGSSPTGVDPYWGTGVWGDSPDTGVYGSGSIGVEGYGGLAVAGFANGTTGSTALYGESPDNSSYALYTKGKVHFNRSGRKSVSAGKSSIVHSLSGVTSGSKVFAVLASNESGRWVRAVVPASGKFTVYFNTRLSSRASVSWFVLD